METYELWDETRCSREMGSTSMADTWTSIIVSGQSSTPRVSKLDKIRAEFSRYGAEVTRYKFSAKDRRQYWRLALTNGTFPRLGQLPRLFLSVPASAILQECHF